MAYDILQKQACNTPANTLSDPSLSAQCIRGFTYFCMFTSGGLIVGSFTFWCGITICNIASPAIKMIAKMQHGAPFPETPAETPGDTRGTPKTHLGSRGGTTLPPMLAADAGCGKWTNNASIPGLPT